MKATDGHTTPKLPVAAATSAAASCSDPDQDPLIVAMGVEPSAEEAEFIALCDELVENCQAERRIYATMPGNTREEERQRDAVLAPLVEEWRRIENRFYGLDVRPQSQAGIRAATRAALASMIRDSDGEITTAALPEYLAWTALAAIDPATEQDAAGAVRDRCDAAEARA